MTWRSIVTIWRCYWWAHNGPFHRLAEFLKRKRMIEEVNKEEAKYGVRKGEATK